MWSPIGAVVAIAALAVTVVHDLFGVSFQADGPTAEPIILTGSSPSLTANRTPGPEISSRAGEEAAPKSAYVSRGKSVIIEAGLSGATADLLAEIRGSSSHLCCGETIWVLARPEGGVREYPRGHCHSSDGLVWNSCVGHAYAAPWLRGTTVSVRAVIIHGGSEEEQYISAAKRDGFPFDSLPFPPVAISIPITMVQS